MVVYDIRHFKNHFIYLPLPCKQLISMHVRELNKAERTLKQEGFSSELGNYCNILQMTGKRKVSVKLLEVSCIKNSLSGRGCYEEEKEMQEKTDEYLTTEAIDLGHLENKSKTCKWASDFIMKVPVKFSCSHPQKTQPQYTANICVSVLVITLLH